MEISPEMAFNVNHLLNTNSTPSPEQSINLQKFILEIDEAISNTDEDISSINEQILVMQAKLLVIQNRRAQLIQQRRNYSRILSPARFLPIEIFGKIFTHATQDCAKHVLNLSAVCQLWRSAALGTPALWSTLELGHHTKESNAIDHIDSWIARAHSYPLSLIIKKQDSRRAFDPVDYICPFIDEHQWKSITLDSNNHESVLPFLEELRSSNLEMLEIFSLTTRYHGGRLADSDILRLGDTPKLRTLALSFKYHCVAFDMLPFPWSQLTSLTIRFSNISDVVLDILEACVNLEEFIVDGSGRGCRSDLNHSINLNRLQKLHTHFFSNTFLLYLKTPSIQEVAVKGNPYKYFSEKFYDYFKKNGSTLLKLSIAPLSYGLVQCIPYFRSLVELRLHDNNYDENGSAMMYEVLDSLIVEPETDPSTIPLPRLKVLEIVCHATEQNQRTFMDVVESRWWSDEEENTRQKEGQLRSLSRIKYAVLMNVHTELNRFCRKNVDFLQARGMKIEYLTPFDGMDKDDFYTSNYYNQA